MWEPPKTFALAVTLASLIFVLPVGVCSAQQKEQRTLEAVRGRIQALEKQIATQIDSRDSTAQALKKVELDIAAAESRLASLSRQGDAQQKRIQALSTQMAAADKRLTGERDALAQQVRASYMSGREEVLKLLLSQETPASVGRMAVYYQYLNRARGERIATVEGDLASLRRLASESREAKAELTRVERDQQAQVAALDRTRKEREALLGKLDQSIASGEAQVAKLKRQAQQLTDLIAELNKVSAQFPTDSEKPFKSVKGKLPWPIQGKLIGDYAEPVRGGPVRRDGVLLAAAKDTPVRAVYHGRVIFADWLPGQGLLIVVDHGDGYMSLYGHNAALLKETGDWVSAGEPIAQVGETGGQRQPALYFEICHNGKALNPHRWIAD